MTDRISKLAQGGRKDALRMEGIERGEGLESPAGPELSQREQWNTARRGGQSQSGDLV